MLADFQKEYLDKCRTIAEHLRAQAMKAQQEYALFTIAEFLRESAFVVETGILQEERKHSPEAFTNQKEKIKIDKGQSAKAQRTEGTMSPSLFSETSETSEKDGKKN